MDQLLLPALLTFLLAGVIKGTVGMGLPMTSIGILSQIADPRIAVTLAVLPIVGGNAWQVFRSGQILSAIKRYWPFATALALFLLATTFVAPMVPTDVLVIALAIVIVAFATINLAVTLPFLPEKYDRAAQLVLGGIGGISGGLTAIWAPPMVVYFLARRLDKDEFVRASGLLFLAGSIPLLVGYIHNGLLDAGTARFSAILVIPTVLGFAAGEAIRRRISTDRFRTAVLVLFLLMGLNLLRKAIF